MGIFTSVGKHLLYSVARECQTDLVCWCLASVLDCETSLLYLYTSCRMYNVFVHPLMLLPSSEYSIVNSRRRWVSAFHCSKIATRDPLKSREWRRERQREREREREEGRLHAEASWRLNGVARVLSRKTSWCR